VHRSCRWRASRCATVVFVRFVQACECIAAVVGAHRGVRRSYSRASYRRVSTSFHNIGIPNSTPRAGGVSGRLAVCLIDADMHVHPQSRLAPPNFTLQINGLEELPVWHLIIGSANARASFSPRVSYARCVMVDIAPVKSPSVFLMHKS
jgi:hypothetical protein